MAAKKVVVKLPLNCATCQSDFNSIDAFLSHGCNVGTKTITTTLAAIAVGQPPAEQNQDQVTKPSNASVPVPDKENKKCKVTKACEGTASHKIIVISGMDKPCKGTDPWEVASNTSHLALTPAVLPTLASDNEDLVEVFKKESIETHEDDIVQQSDEEPVQESSKKTVGEMLVGKVTVKLIPEEKVGDASNKLVPKQKTVKVPDKLVPKKTKKLSDEFVADPEEQQTEEASDEEHEHEDHTGKSSDTESVPSDEDLERRKLSIEEHTEKSGEVVWRHKALVKLLTVYQTLLENHLHRSPSLWREIAAVMSSEGFAVTHTACHRKLKEFKQRYLDITAKGEGDHMESWIYYNYMRIILSDEASKKIIDRDIDERPCNKRKCDSDNAQKSKKLKSSSTDAGKITSRNVNGTTPDSPPQQLSPNRKRPITIISVKPNKQLLKPKRGRASVKYKELKRKTSVKKKEVEHPQSVQVKLDELSKKVRILQAHSNLPVPPTPVHDIEHLLQSQNALSKQINLPGQNLPTSIPQLLQQLSNQMPGLSQVTPARNTKSPQIKRETSSPTLEETKAAETSASDPQIDSNQDPLHTIAEISNSLTSAVIRLMALRRRQRDSERLQNDLGASSNTHYDSQEEDRADGETHEAAEEQKEEEGWGNTVLFEDDLWKGLARRKRRGISLRVKLMKEKNEPHELVAKQLMPSLSDLDFRAHFRMTRSTFRILCQELHVLVKTKFVSIERKVMATLWLLFHTENFREVAARFHFNKAGLYNHLCKICIAINEMKEDYIVWPQGADLNAAAAGYENSSGMPGVMGALGTTHIRIPPNKDLPTSYKNRYAFNSIQIQAVCDSNLQFLDIYVGQPGSEEVESVFQSSALYTFLENGHLEEGYHLVASSAYHLKPYLMVPFSDRGHLTTSLRRFNERHSAARTHISQAFQLMRSKFKRIQNIDIRCPDRTTTIMSAVCVLYNFILKNEGYDVGDFEDIEGDKEIINDPDQSLDVSDLDLLDLIGEPTSAQVKRMELTNYVSW